MRDLEIYVDPADVRRALAGVWRTDEFRAAAARPDHPVHAFVERFARVPRFVYTMDVPEVERCHFTPWFGAIGRRSYENDALHDLFWFHEIVHMATLDHDPSASWTAWAGKMALNEVRASIWSEALIHFHVPALREHAFDREIWVDRWLDRRCPPDEAWMLAQRWRATAYPADPIEERIALFQDENRRWAGLWRERWREVEEATSRLVTAAGGSARERARAADAHADWLVAGAEDPRRPYPFPDEAEAFARIYWSTRDRARSA